MSKDDPSLTPAFARGFDEHRRAQARQGLRMSPAERLRWLEQTMSTLRRWQGRARDAPLRTTDPAD